MAEPLNDDGLFSSFYHDQVIEAAFLHTRRGCYFVGPYAQRVSFASQQYRALDLVTGLKKIRGLGTTARVAVIGGGLAGLMAAVVLRSYKARVHLYESAGRILDRQRGASHRVIHPTIARWPQEPLSLSTQFPVFDWCASTCDRVIANLEKEWELYLKAQKFDPSNPVILDYMMFPNKRVSGVVTAMDGNDTLVNLTFEDDAPENEQLSSQPYHFVVVATGYGSEENHTPGAISYWADDKLEELRGTPDFRRTHYYVSGAGDGGLIDLLRFMHGDFQKGWLGVTLAQALDQTPIADEIRTAEHDALMLTKSIAMGSRKQNFKQSYNHPDVIDGLADAYMRLAKKIWDEPAYSSIHEMLIQSLEKHEMRGRLSLVSPHRRPFVPYSAPIHKLMIAHASLNNYFKHENGILIQFKEKYAIEMPDKKRDILDANARVIVRHGAGDGMATILREYERESLSGLQLMLADRIEVRHPRRIPLPAGYPCSREDRQKFLNIRLPHVKDLVEAIDDRFDVDVTDAGFIYPRVDYRSLTPNEGCAGAIGSAQGLGLKLPSTLFGHFTGKPTEPEAFPLL